MTIKRSGKRIFGAALTSKEQKAMDIAIKDEISEITSKNETEIDAIILWVLHSKFGFGETRLKKFYDCFIPEYRALIERYEMPEDGAWLCTKLLRDMGIDLEAWRSNLTL